MQYRRVDEVIEHPARQVKGYDGRIVSTRARPPTTISVDFYRAMVKQFGETKTDRIMRYIMGVINKSFDYTDHHSGYSAMRVPWDVEANKQMTHDQKVCCS